MAALVIDSSLAAAWCFPDERTDYTNAVLQVVSTPLEATAPRLWAYEVRKSILMGLRRKRIGKADAEYFLDSLKGFAHTVDRSAFLRRRVQLGRPSRADRL